MAGLRRDQQLLADFRVMDVAPDLEFHFPFEDDHQFVCRVREVFPALSWRVYPQFARNTTRTPISGDLASVWGLHCLASNASGNGRLPVAHYRESNASGSA
jgi:hypothetical protein